MQPITQLWKRRSWILHNSFVCIYNITVVDTVVCDMIGDLIGDNIIFGTHTSFCPKDIEAVMHLFSNLCLHHLFISK